VQKQWILLPQDQDKCSSLSKQLNISASLAQVLINRQITSPSQFLKPRLADLKDPFDIPNIRKAAERVIRSIKGRENILIYGDYDVDGITATVILLETIQYLGMEAKHYIPYRYNEGYSLNCEAIKKAKQDKADLIITVDCGISNKKEIEFANSLGIDVVVTDHHNIPTELPAAYAIVNPKMIKEPHPSKNLSGAGVAFKFAWALLRLLKNKDNKFLTDLLDLVALGTIADVVPLLEENRILASAGLNIMNKKERLGLKHLVEAASVSGEISIHHVNFSLAPRINAAGRLEHASISLKLLSSSDHEEAQKIAEQLNLINRERQKIGTKIQKEVFKIIEAEQLFKNNIIVLKGADWHPGVIGIVASKITDTYFRPAVLIGEKGAVGRGSARSIKGVNVFEILSECQDIYRSFGGHKGAAGFEIEIKDYDNFYKRILEKADQAIAKESLVPHLYIDTELSPKSLTLKSAQEINLLSPFGEENRAPFFITQNIPLDNFKLVGANKTHLKATFGGLDVIGFNLGHLANSLSLSKNYDLVYNLESNEWNGFERVQLKLVDMRESL